MDNLIERHIKKWCEDSGWTDLFVHQRQFYAFPPGAVVPLAVPTKVIESAKKIREILLRGLKQLFLIIVQSLAFIVLTYLCGFPIWVSLIGVILLSVIVISIRQLWNWFCFIRLWINSR